MFFPPSYLGELRRLAKEYGRDEVVGAVRESCRLTNSPVFDYRRFAG